MTVSAAVRFRPLPPALREMRKTGGARVALEILDSFSAVFRRPIEVFVRDAVFFHRAPNDRQHRDELTEDEHLVAAVHACLDELSKCDQLARVFVSELARQVQ